jgi:hypothetical protein
VRCPTGAWGRRIRRLAKRHVPSLASNAPHRRWQGQVADIDNRSQIFSGLRRSSRHAPSAASPAGTQQPVRSATSAPGRELPELCGPRGPPGSRRSHADRLRQSQIQTPAVPRRASPDRINKQPNIQAIHSVRGSSSNARAWKPFSTWHHLVSEGWPGRGERRFDSESACQPVKSAGSAK